MSLSTTSTDASLSSQLSSISTTPALTTQTTVAQTPTSSPFSTGFGGGHGGGGGGNGGGGNGGGGNNNNTGGTLATSAALYLYTFLATLVLLLSVSAAIVIRSFILRRRHRRMVEEAIRNGTWVPPSPSRPVRVDLSKKPVLWEAYIDNQGSISYSHGGGKSLNPEWMMDQTKDWDMIRPISAAYLASSTALGPMTSVPTATESTLQNPIPGPTPVEEPSHSAASSTRTPRHRVIFSRAMRMLNPRPVETPPLPAANLSNANINTGGSGAGDAHILMTELDEKTQGPSLIRVSVLIAMPSPPSSSSTAPSTPTSVITSSPPPPINQTTSSAKLSTVATQSHPLQINPAFPLPLPPPQNDEPLLPHIEVGVADVLVVPPDLVTQDEGINERKFRGSVGSRDSVASEGNPG